MSRADLTTLLQSTVHRETDTSPPWDNFINRANVRIGRDLRARENTVALQLLADPYALPSGFQEMILVETQQQNTWQPVRPAGGNELSTVQRASGAAPLWYWIANGSVYPWPAAGDDLRVTYYAALELGPDPADTNATLDAFEQLYLAAAVTFFAQWSQDESLQAMWQQEYVNEISNINAARREQRQPVSTSNYRYAGGTFAT